MYRRRRGRREVWGRIHRIRGYGICDMLWAIIVNTRVNGCNCANVCDPAAIAHRCDRHANRQTESTSPAPRVCGIHVPRTSDVCSGTRKNTCHLPLGMHCPGVGQYLGHIDLQSDALRNRYKCTKPGADIFYVQKSLQRNEARAMGPKDRERCVLDR